MPHQYSSRLLNVGRRFKEFSAVLFSSVPASGKKCCYFLSGLREVGKKITQIEMASLGIVQIFFICCFLSSPILAYISVIYMWNIWSNCLLFLNEIWLKFYFCFFFIIFWCFLCFVPRDKFRNVERFNLWICAVFYNLQLWRNVFNKFVVDGTNIGDCKEKVTNS